MRKKNIDKMYHKQDAEYDTEKTKPERPELPKLLRGQGSMSWFREGVIVYRKYVQCGDDRVQAAVYGKTVNEVMRLMRAKEAELARKFIKDDAKTLEIAMREWIETKELSLKQTSYDRIESVFNNQICGHPIARIRYQQIGEKEIREHLETLIRKDRLSWSTVKKCYDLLNGFFRQSVQRKRLDVNPMEFVKMPTQGQMETKTKDICYLTKDEIQKFTEEATRVLDGDMPAYNWGKAAPVGKTYHVPAYRYGWIFIFDIYTGLRIGELCALRWKDIDFKAKTVSVTKSVHDVKNREYDEDNPEKMRLNKINRYVIVEGSTKTEATRLIPLNSKAMEAIEEYRKTCTFTKPDDYVVATKYGKCNNLHNMYRRLNDILRRAGIDKSSGAHGVHMLRHTCASLLFEHGVPVEIIASILGNSPEVCRKTYVHFCQQQKADAIRKIEAFEI